MKTSVRSDVVGVLRPLNERTGYLGPFVVRTWDGAKVGEEEEEEESHLRPLSILFCPIQLSMLSAVHAVRELAVDLFAICSFVSDRLEKKKELDDAFLKELSLVTVAIRITLEMRSEKNPRGKSNFCCRQVET